jgi:hypothetical protein
LLKSFLGRIRQFFAQFIEVKYTSVPYWRPSIQPEDPGGDEPECAWSPHIYQGPAESRSGLGRSIVTMVQSAESFLRKGPPRSSGTNPAVRCPLLKPEMRAVFMMVTNILGEQSL